MTDLTSAAQAAFAAVARWEPRVHAFVDFNEAQARRRHADAASRASTASGQLTLAGWAVGVKDIIDCAGLPTRCGADFLPAEPATRDAAVVADLLRHGAFIMGKTVTATFAHFDPGPTGNPRNVAHTPGGSSSGSAAAVACGMVRLALGTQTLGSINRPASFCGVVGFKPTHGRLPLDGVFVVSPTMDTLGFFTANVRDARLAFDALQPGEPTSTQKKPFSTQSTPPIRIGVIEDLGDAPADEEMQRVVRETAARLADAGHVVRDVTLPAPIRASHTHAPRLVAAEAAVSHATLFEQFADRYTPKLRELVETGRTISTDELNAVRRHRKTAIAAVHELFDDHDILLTPSAPGAAPQGLAATGSPRMSLPWTYTTCPTLTLPAKLNPHGLPLGVQLVARPNDDQSLLAAGESIAHILPPLASL